MKSPNEARALRPLPAPDLRQPLAAAAALPRPDRRAGVYVWLFWQELYYLVLAAFGNADALSHILDSVTVEGGERPTSRTRP